MRFIFAILLVAIVPSLASAGGYGLGMKSCGQFTKSYADNPQITEDLYFTWAEGFMSGLNMANEANNLPYRALNGVEMDRQKLQIRSFCDVHPLAQYAAAIVAVYNTFPIAR